MLDALLELRNCAWLLFEDPPGSATVAQVVEDPCGWFLDASAIVVTPMPNPPSPPCHHARDSPTSVVVNIVEKSTPSMLQLSAHALALIYDSLTSSRAWDASFSRGPRRAHGQRQLATKHLDPVATDGWNVVIGALELAREWALRTTSTVKAEGHDPHRLDRNTRLRLAACLSVAWKFQRACHSYFPHRFKDVGEFHGYPNLYDGHTRELAHVAYGFFFDSEQTAFGGFHEDNLDQVKALYQTMLMLEADLVGKVPIFSLLTDNVQVNAEDRLGALYDEGALSSEASMAARSIVPFFVRAAIAHEAYEELTVAGGDGADALVCVACACVCVGTSIPAQDSGGNRPPCFSAKARHLALGLVQAALLASESSYVRHGCFGDPAWVGHALVTAATLRLARMALRSAGAR